MIESQGQTYIIDTELINDWDFEKNKIMPESVKLHSNKKVYWKCHKGHPSYLASPSKRAIGNSCPVCSNHKIIRDINSLEILHPELMEEWDWDKNTAININPGTISEKSGAKAWWVCKKCGNEWKAIVNNRVRIGSGCPYCANLKVKKGFNDLASTNPELAEEWDYNRNHEICPDSITAYYAKKVWWKCKSCGESWQATPNARHRHGCPYCGHHMVRMSESIDVLFPELVKEWDFSKNQGILPKQFSRGSEKSVWWICNKGHSWKANINSRTSGSGCPICSNKKVLKGFNDLFTTNLELKPEWDFEKNSSIRPESITAGSNKKVYWLCSSCGESWEASVASRTNGYGCPRCGSEKAVINRLRNRAYKNPLFEQFPELEGEWNYKKNPDISLISVHSNKRVWWICSKGHEWQTTITARTSNKSGCPYCAGQKVLTGINDLETINPMLAKEWDYEKNTPLLPSEVLSHSSKYVWWKCPICGLSWKSKVNNRANGRGCPSCNPQGTSFIEQAIFFYLNKIYPDAINRHKIDNTEFDIYIDSIKTAIEYDGAYFHSIRNSELREKKKDSLCLSKGIRLIRLREKPLSDTGNCENISCDCTNWKHLEDTIIHLLKYLKVDAYVKVSIKDDYEAIVNSKRVLLKEKAFGIQYPEILAQWDYERNFPLKPEYFSRGSDYKAWWKCNKGHSWQARIANRCRGNNCPICHNIKIRI